MSNYDNTNRASLFKNKKKTQDNHPDYTGQLDCEGVEYWMSAWIKKSKAGETFMSISIQPKDDSKPKVVQKKPQTLDDMDSDCPF